MTISIRNVDSELYTEFQIEAKRKGKTAGEALNEAIRDWVRAHQGKRGNLLDIQPRSFGPDSKLWSQQVDEILAEENPR